MFKHEVIFQHAPKLPPEFYYKNVRSLAKEALPDTSQFSLSYPCLRFIQQYCEIVSGNHSGFFLERDPQRYSELKSMKQEPLRISPRWERYLCALVDVIPYDLMNPLTRFFCEELSRSQPSYRRQFRLKEIPEWLDRSFSKGESLFDSCSTLAIASNILKTGLRQNNEDTCREAIAVIMQWAKVYFATDKRPNNQSPIRDLYTSSSLVTTMHDNLHALKRNSPNSVTLMNSGWSKVWACMEPDQYIMLDGKVSHTVSRLLKKFSQKKALPVDLLCQKLGFYQVGHGGRRVSGVPEAMSIPSRWAQSMLAVSRLLQDILAMAKTEDIPILGGYPDDLRGLELKLSMMST